MKGSRTRLFDQSRFNPLTPNSAKQMAPCKSTAKEVSFEWSDHETSDSKI